MPPRVEDMGKSKSRRKRIIIQVVDPATQSQLAPMPTPPSSSNGSSASTASSVATLTMNHPAMNQVAPPPFPFPFPYTQGSSPPFPYPYPYPQGSSPSFPYGFSPQQPQAQQLQIPQKPQTQQLQIPPQPSQEHVTEDDMMDGSGVVNSCEDDTEIYLRDARERYVIKPSGNSFLPCKPTANAIRDVIQNKYKRMWKTYGDIDDDEKDDWFNLFREKYTWNLRYEKRIRCNFHIKAAARLSDMLRNARVRFERKRTRPHWIGTDLMKELVQNWGTDEFKLKSEKAKKNRASEKGSCIHTGGCISNAEHARRLAKKLGREPFINEIHKKTHTYGSGQYVDERSRICEEEYDKQLANALSRGCQVDEALSLKTWTKVVGDKHKGRLYGAGSLAGNYQKGIAATLRSTLNHGEGSSRQPKITPEIREMIHKMANQEQLREQLATQEQLMQQLLERQQKYDEQLAQLSQENAGRTDVAHNLSVSGLNSDVEPFEVFGEEDEEDNDKDDEDDC